MDPEIHYLRELPVIRRLSEVKQLPFCQNVLPGASHSRLEHMTGAYLLAKIFASKPVGSEMNEEVKRVLLVASFVHDAGHGPLGHSLEQMAEFLSGGSKPKNFGKLDKVVLDKILYDPKEKLTIALEDIFGSDKKSFDMLKQVVIPFIEPSGASLETNSPELSYLLDLTNSDVDLDRLDYLSRDTLHGAPNFRNQCPVRNADDLTYFIDNMQLATTGSSKRRILAYKSDMLLKLQEVLRYRKEMYDSIYLSKEKIAIDTMMCHAVYDTIIENGLQNHHEDLFQIVKFKDQDLMMFITLVGSDMARLLVNYVTSGRYYVPVATYDLPLPSDQKHEKFKEKHSQMTNTFGFGYRTGYEDQVAESIRTFFEY